ncbi:MAG: eukaryotic-like serine/threonine-protein kinase [Acidobacteriota bacterium]|jgi:formylglycine-generating enzyme required for sulfatase activity|nr:eukaryotic-like serine/threonine-protein kinase [Acidobacteriota bacterium]
MPSAERHITVYCPTHKINFEVLTGGRIVCAAEQHALALDFPDESFWEYCCDCQRFRPSDLKHGGQSTPACPACERTVARRYLCEHCKVLSVESDDAAGVKRKTHRIAAGGAVGPDCPGCRRAPNSAAVRMHDCDAAATTFATARDLCPFCEEPLDQKTAGADAASGSLDFPAAAAQFLKTAGGREVRVRLDLIRDLFVKDAGGGPFALLHDWGVPGGIVYLLPRLMYFQTRQDFYNYYQPFYDCAHPLAGEVWIVKPAVVERVVGGWRLREKGVLEVKDAASPKPPAVAPRKEQAGRNQQTAPKQPTTQKQQAAQRPERRPTTATPAAAASESRKAPSQREAQREDEREAQREAEHKAEREAQRRAVKPSSTVSTPTGAGGGAPPSSPSASPSSASPSASRSASSAEATGRRLPVVAVGALVALIGLGLFIASLSARRGAVSNTSNASATPGGSAKSSSQGATPPGMVYVPGGEFIMGSDGDAYERPKHRVSVKPFFIDTYEVTCEDYAKFVRAAGHAPPPLWTNGTYPEGWARRPVTGVTWYDAAAYAAWAGKRLPTESQWEFAARGNDGRRYPWGDEWEPGAANVGGAGGELADVGSRRSPSPFGAYDMSGNAWEWTATDFDIYPGGDASLMKKQRPGKVIRGGCCTSVPAQATTTYRGVWPPQGEDYSRTGFRCVLDAPKP